jgi:general secretion pathway protein C
MEMDNRSRTVRGVLSRISEKGPKLAAVTLAGLLVVVAIRLVLALRQETDLLDHSKGVTPRALLRAQSDHDIQNIVAGHLFGMPPGAPSSEAPTAAPSDLVLLGTFAVKDPRYGMAIIGIDGHPALYLVGKQVGNALLQSVYLDHVILDRDGTLVTLQWRRAGSVAGLLRPATYVDNLGRKVDRPPGEVDKMIRTVALVDEATGKLHGLRVYPVASGAPMRALGLYPGDLVTAINGAPLNDVASSRAALDAIQSVSEANVTVERQNKTLDLVLHVAAASASLDSQSSGAEPPE